MNKSIKLAHSINGAPATPQNCGMNVGRWYDNESRISVQPAENGKVTLITSKGEYVLEKHATQNYYCGRCAGIPVHVILKPMTGEIIWFEKENKKEELSIDDLTEDEALTLSHFGYEAVLKLRTAKYQN